MSHYSCYSPFNGMCKNLSALLRRVLSCTSKYIFLEKAVHSLHKLHKNKITNVISIGKQAWSLAMFDNNMDENVLFCEDIYEILICTKNITEILSHCYEILRNLYNNIDSNNFEVELICTGFTINNETNILKVQNHNCFTPLVLPGCEIYIKQKGKENKVPLFYVRIVESDLCFDEYITQRDSIFFMKMDALIMLMYMFCYNMYIVGDNIKSYITFLESIKSNNHDNIKIYQDIFCKSLYHDNIIKIYLNDIPKNQLLHCKRTYVNTSIRDMKYNIKKVLSYCVATCCVDPMRLSFYNYKYNDSFCIYCIVENMFYQREIIYINIDNNDSNNKNKLPQNTICCKKQLKQCSTKINKNHMNGEILTFVQIN